MKKCNICGTEQKQVAIMKLSFNDSQIMDIPQYNINFLTYFKGKIICDKCMDVYYKVFALQMDKDFSCGGNEYYSDGRNLD